MSERRMVSLSMPTAAILARTTSGLNCVPRTAGYAPRHYKPCPDCNDTGWRCWLMSRSTLSMRCHCGATPPQPLNAPVAVVPSSSAVAVKAGGVATLTGGDTTQPETQR